MKEPGAASAPGSYQSRLSHRTLTDGPLFAPLDAILAAGVGVNAEHTTHGPGRSAYSTAHDATHWAGCAVAVFRATLSTADGPLSLGSGGQGERGQDESRGEQ